MKRFVCALILFLALPAGSAHAWEVGKNYGLDTDAAVLKDQMNAAAYTLDSGTNHILTTTCLIFPFQGPDNCTNDPARQQAMFRNSAIGNIASAMGTMYDNPPANLALWIRDTGESLGFIPKQAYAQGVGFNGLAPLLPIWKAFRNIAYVLLALAMIVVGFMVMMRKKIDPKTVITVQNSLPRIVIALILITFSYAIVGLMIDLMYLVIAFLHLIVQANLPDASGSNAVASGLLSFRINYVSGGLMDLFGSIFGSLNNWNPLSQVAGDFAQGQWGEMIRDFASGLVTYGLTAGPLFLFILGLAYLFAFVRILFMLLGSYVQVILAVLTGPIQILADVFPGATGFVSWIKNIAANLIVFPITIVLLMIANAISQNFGAERLWTPPLLPQPVMPNLGIAGGDIGGLGGLAEALISIGIILMIPNIVNSLKEAFKTKPLVGGGAGGGIGGAVTTLSTLYYAQAMTPQVIKDRVSQIFGGKPKTE